MPDWAETCSQYRSKEDREESMAKLEGFPFPNPLAGAAEKLFDEEAFASALAAGLGEAVAKLAEGKKLEITIRVVNE